MNDKTIIFKINYSWKNSNETTYEIRELEEGELEIGYNVYEHDKDIELERQDKKKGKLLKVFKQKQVIFFLGREKFEGGIYWYFLFFQYILSQVNYIFIQYVAKII